MTRREYHVVIEHWHEHDNHSHWDVEIVDQSHVFGNYVQCRRRTRLMASWKAARLLYKMIRKEWW